MVDIIAVLFQTTAEILSRGVGCQQLNTACLLATHTMAWVSLTRPPPATNLFPELRREPGALKACVKLVLSEEASG